MSDERVEIGPEGPAMVWAGCLVRTACWMIAASVALALLLRLPGSGCS